MDFFFRLKSLNCFPVKTHVFGKPFVFCTFCLKSGGFEFAPARGSPASVSDHVMTSQDYIKVEQVRTWLLSSSLAKFQQFESECFFQVCFNLFLPAYMVHVQFLPLGFCVSFVFFSMRGLDFSIFLVWNLQTVIRWNPCFRKVFHFLYLFLMMEPWICCGMW